MGKGEPGLGFWWGSRKGLKFLSFFPGTQSLKASAAVGTATCHYVVSILMTVYGNLDHSALSQYKHEASYIIQIAAFSAKDKIKPQDSWTLSFSDIIPLNYIYMQLGTKQLSSDHKLEWHTLRRGRNASLMGHRATDSFSALIQESTALDHKYSHWLCITIKNIWVVKIYSTGCLSVPGRQLGSFFVSRGK